MSKGSIIITGASDGIGKALAYEMAKQSDGAFLLRIEDIDQSRARPKWEQQIYEDLKWLGLSWDQDVCRQSDNIATYKQALEILWRKGLLYPCTCNRRDIAAAASAPQEGAPMLGPDGVIYPGMCRAKTNRTGPLPQAVTLRLDTAKLVDTLTGTLRYTETGLNMSDVLIQSKDLPHTIGDVVIARQDMGTSYHLSVVIDDAAQNISHVVRGADLADATKIHVLLQNALNLPTPIYHHHKLIRDNAGKRLAKRDDARAIAKYREDGLHPDDLRQMLGV